MNILALKSAIPYFDSVIYFAGAVFSSLLAAYIFDWIKKETRAAFFKKNSFSIVSFIIFIFILLVVKDSFILLMLLLVFLFLFFIAVAVRDKFILYELSRTKTVVVEKESEINGLENKINSFKTNNREFLLDELNRITFFNHNLVHFLRDSYFKLQKKFHDYKLNLESINTSNNEETKKEEFRQNLKRDLEDVSKEVVNNLSQHLSIVSQKKVNACIKFYRGQFPAVIKSYKDLVGLKLYTVARDSTSINRNSEDAEITGNSDFLFLLLCEQDDEVGSAFAISDLPEYAKLLLKAKEFHKDQPTYINSTKNWENKYKTTIVVPIRMKVKYNSELFNSIDKCHLEKYHILGFLCVDSLDVDAFPLEKIELFKQICYCYSDALYKYYERYVYYREKI